ncbi:type 1 glutamine amidotransferase [Gordonia paraffinivorans]|uniref:GMP synthase [glutamine-hydrolyzing] n=1 Tax=Gordonia paraffinivorans TaxID=175628 RepID=A0ABD7V2E2_9ACTN|nr:type 1 glutamine amidotransferase [Gordonia paraffinivorans]MCD2145065.1 type 1 glutamine amidotransferase [Gordonia paraffinivorans]VFA88385.1 GMP synthase [glutamine-hydrolyzing] [Gordonia paraffinivorans]
MSGRVLALVHGVRPEWREAVLGTLLPAFRNRAFSVEIRDVEDGPLPDPAGFDVVCVTGSPDSAYDESLPWLRPELTYLEDAIARGVPILGVCFGSQILARALGGSVAPSARPEHGFTTVDTTRPDLVEAGPWMEYHHDTVSVSGVAEVVARNDAGVQAYVSGPHLGVQFHPEITPDVFRAWREGFTSPRSGIDDGKVDTKGIVADIENSSADAEARCDRLVERFLAHAGVRVPAAG